MNLGLSVLGFLLGTTDLNVTHTPGYHRPVFDPREWWGPPELKGVEDTRIIRSPIVFDKWMIADLRHRLDQHRQFHRPLPGVGFNYGFNSDIIPEWVDYWANDYLFTKREAFINKYPLFKTNIQGLDLNFVWIEAKLAKLLLHGFPGSILEFYDTIPYLTADSDQRDFVVEIVAPSLPGFGFSDGAVRPGLGASEIGVILRNLMKRLGHDHFYIQGGDFGSIIASYMVTFYPESILGFHTNFPFVMTLTAAALTIKGEQDPQSIVPPGLEERMYPLERVLSNTLIETGYQHEQATKPDVLAIGMADSPVALLTYILQMFSMGYDGRNKNLSDGNLRHIASWDRLIDNLMMYWAPNCMTTAMRLYAETFNKRHFGLGLDDLPTYVPVWALQAQNEIIYQPPAILRTKYKNLLNTTVLHFGGHFFAFQLPDVFANDVLKAIGYFRDWHRSE